MAAQRFGGKYSPDAKPTVADAGAPPAPPFRNRTARRVSLRARLMFLAPLPLLFAGLGSITRGSARRDAGRARRLRRADARGLAPQ